MFERRRSPRCKLGTNTNMPGRKTQSTRRSHELPRTVQVALRTNTTETRIHTGKHGPTRHFHGPFRIYTTRTRKNTAVVQTKDDLPRTDTNLLKRDSIILKSDLEVAT
ncbi:hypothetical protein DPMN_158496 [Dreissena polymorpha]|uniref:Uncharacterized protein n=1 Tax=Dreissena polymorpha TaxID=45954 RepID=A0A9D4EMK1_DREPO|nr:hypothetical protein DPMN_158496 [Dreissena polymorpha]